MSNDEFPELRLLDHPIEVPPEFRDRLRGELLSTFGSDSVSDADGTLVPLRRVEDRPLRRVSSFYWRAAAGVILIATIGAALGLIARSGDDGDQPVASDRAVACQRFVESVPSMSTLDRSDQTVEWSDAIDRLRAGIEQLTDDLARLDDTSAGDLSRLRATAGALRESGLDLKRGDEAGSIAALDFALEQLAALETVEVSLSETSAVCH
jgi:hypothetical protein